MTLLWIKAARHASVDLGRWPRNAVAMQVLLWSCAGGCAALAGLASAADHARARRRDPDRVGWMPWPLVLVLALMLAAVFAALALKT